MNYNITEYQAKYIANFLTRRLPANDLNKLTASLQDAQVDLPTEDVQAKKKAAEEYCKNASEYTAKHGGKPWKYHLLRHDIVERTSSFEYLMALS